MKFSDENASAPPFCCLMNKRQVCITVCEKRAGDLAQSIERAKKEADIVEIRLDCLDKDELETALRDVKEMIEARRGYPFILTLRPLEQGGAHELDEAQRFDFWSQLFLDENHQTNFVDLELDLAEQFQGRKAQLNWGRVICSYHDFMGVPANLFDIYERMAQTPARVLKIAVYAVDVMDCIPVFRLLEHARQTKRGVICLAMGNAGLATRILGPARGSFLTYAKLDERQPAAPGQISISDLLDVYRVREIDTQTRVMGLIGSPVMHSLSPHIHNAAFAAVGLNAVFIPFEVTDALEFLRRMVRPPTRAIDLNLSGLSVTAPHKNAVLDQMDWVEPSALEIGAINTIVIRGDELHGYNTDADGFRLPLEDQVGELRGTKAAVIGAGGAARSVLWSLKEAGAHPTVFARHRERGAELASRFDASSQMLDAKVSFKDYDVVVNATPLGTLGHSEDETPAHAEQLEGARLAYDLVYNPRETRFLREAMRAGCETLGGLSMLFAQATMQFKLWTGLDAPVEVMSEAAERALEKQK